MRYLILILISLNISSAQANECVNLFVQNKIIDESKIDIAIQELRELREQQYSQDTHEASIAKIVFKKTHEELLKVLPASEIQKRIKGLKNNTEKTNKTIVKTEPAIQTDFLIKIAPYLKEAEELWNGSNFANKTERKRESIIYALQNEKTELIPALIHLGAEINTRNSLGETPLTYISDNALFSLRDAQVLIENGADVNIKNSSKESPLQMATRTDRADFVDLLFEKGAKIDSKTQFADIIRSDIPISIIQKYFENGLKLSAKDKNGNTALHLAAKADNVIVIRFLVAQGIDINAKNKNGQTALFLASDAATTLTLIALGIDINARDINGKTALHQVTQFGYDGAIEALLESGANINIKDNHNLTPFQYAQDKGPATIKLYKKHGAK